jgi:hypothetical protein
MDSSERRRLGATAALLFLSPALVATLSGCGNDCDSNRSTPDPADDCGTSRSGYHGGGGGFVGSGARASAPRSGGFGGFGRFFSGGG